MRKIVTIVIVVWVACFVICIADLVFGVSRALKKGWRVSWSKVVQMVYEALLMAPLVAMLVLCSRFFELLDFIHQKMSKNED